jgi:magnesium transporter
MRVSNLLVPDIGELLHSDPDAIKDFAEEIHPADLADLIEQLPEDDRVILVRHLTDAQARAVLDEIELSRRAQLFAKLPPDRAAHLANRMSADERADVFALLPESVCSALLSRMETEERTDVKTLLLFPPSSAGGLMTTDYVALPFDLPTEKAIEHVRRTAEQMETVYEAYAVDSHGTLLGSVKLEKLVLARPETKVSALMDPSVLSVAPLTDQEEVARVISKYDLLALPVIDERRRMLGIITVDDVVDVLEEEHTEDIQKMGAVEPLEAPYFQAHFGDILKKRASWLVLLFVGQFLTSTAMKTYEHDLAAVLDLALFIPLVISSGGNSGAQSSALIIRAMSLAQVSLSDWRRVLLRELAMGLLLGLLLGLIGVMRAFWLDTDVGVAFTVGGSLIGIVLAGSTVGALLPIVLSRVKLDPAVSSAPLIASLVDVCGLVIYFSAARLFLPLALRT